MIYIQFTFFIYSIENHIQRSSVFKRFLEILIKNTVRFTRRIFALCDTFFKSIDKTINRCFIAFYISLIYKILFKIIIKVFILKISRIERLINF